MKNSKGDHLPLMQAYDDPRDFLLAVMNDLESPIKIRIEAAAALMPYFHAELGDELSE